MVKDKIILEKGVYYMISNGEKIPVDIDAPPQFKAIIDNVLKEAKWTSKKIGCDENGIQIANK